MMPFPDEPYWPSIDERGPFGVPDDHDDNEPDEDFGDQAESEWLMECPYCEGEPFDSDCEECGGSGWY